MTNNKLVSIITPVYNAEDFLGLTIDSVLNQTYSNYELILIDDRSTDKSREVIEKYTNKDSRIKSIFLENNVGVAEARNKGIKEAKGKFVAFLDSDDIWKPEKLEKQVDFMLQNDAAFSCTGYSFINENGDSLDKKVEVPHCLNYRGMLKHNPVGCFTVIIDIDKVQNFKMHKIRHEDYAAWLSILKQGHNVYGLNEDLGYYRKREKSLSSNKIKAATWTWNIFRNVEKLSLVESVYYFIYYIARSVKKHLL